MTNIKVGDSVTFKGSKLVRNVIAVDGLYVVTVIGFDKPIVDFKSEVVKVED